MIREENYKYLYILEADNIKQIKEKIRNYYLWKNKKTFPKRAQQQRSQQRNKHLGSPFCKIRGAILKMEKWGTQTYGPKDKDVPCS